MPTKALATSGSIVPWWSDGKGGCWLLLAVLAMAVVAAVPLVPLLAIFGVDCQRITNSFAAQPVTAVHGATLSGCSRRAIRLMISGVAHLAPYLLRKRGRWEPSEH